MAKKAKLEYFIVCDDIRREDTGKLIYIGVYGADIQVFSLPKDIRLSACAAFRCDQTGDQEITLRIMVDGKFHSEKTRIIEFKGKNNVGILAFSGIPITVSKEGQLDFQVKIGDQKFVSALKLPVGVRETD